METKFKIKWNVKNKRIICLKKICTVFYLKKWDKIVARSLYCIDYWVLTPIKFIRERDGFYFHFFSFLTKYIYDWSCASIRLNLKAAKYQNFQVGWNFQVIWQSFVWRIYFSITIFLFFSDFPVFIFITLTIHLDSLGWWLKVFLDLTLKIQI